MMSEPLKLVEEYTNLYGSVFEEHRDLYASLLQHLQKHEHCNCIQEIFLLLSRNKKADADGKSATADDDNNHSTQDTKPNVNVNVIYGKYKKPEY